MLNKFKMFAGVALAILAFASCEKEETSMSVYDLPGRAKVSGYVEYNVKDSLYEDGYVEGVWEPKRNVEVLAKITNAAISGDENNKGYTEFRTKTNAEGYYEFELPVPEKAIQVILQVQTFEGIRSSFDSLRNKELYCSEEEGVFTCPNKTITIGANEIKTVDFEYEFSEGEMSSTSQKLTVNVYKGVYIDGDVKFIKPDLSSFKVTIKDDNNNIEEVQETEDGKAMFDIVRPRGGYLELTVSVDNSPSSVLVMPDELNSYQGLKGSYQQFGVDVLAWSDLEKMWKERYAAWETIETELPEMEEAWMNEHGDHYNVREFESFRLKTKKEIWMRETGKEWNEEWNNKWTVEDLEVLGNKMIEDFWKKSFTSQTEVVSNNAYTEVNVFMVFNPDNIKGYYGNMVDDDEYGEYDYYTEWIEAVVNKNLYNKGTK